MQEFAEWMRIAEAQKGGTAGHDNDGVRALFYNRPVLDPKATEIEGYPVYVTKPFVEIRIPGDPRSVVHQEVKTDEFKKRFATAWEAFQRGQSGPVDGTPIELFPALTVTQVATLKHAGVMTIEQLAGVPDGSLPGLGPQGRAMRERAQQHLKGSSETEKELRAQLAAQEARVKELEARINQFLMAPHSAADDGEADEDDETPPQPATDRMAVARAARAAKRAATAA